LADIGEQARIAAGAAEPDTARPRES
jgi:hypothetical protein